MATVERLAELYTKVKTGTATEDERCEYQIGIKTSCVDEKFLTSWVHDAAKRLTTK